MIEPLLDIQALQVRYRTPRGVLTAVDGVDLRVQAGETVALIGESGCGKTSLGKAVLRLMAPTSGRILFQGADLAALPPRRLKPLRRDLQMIFQDPLAALDPRHAALRIVQAPLALHGTPRAQRAARAQALFEQVGLPWSLRERLPHQLSGGQRQRLNIARALATSPRLVVCDEPVSALDVTLQTQVLALLRTLQDTLGVAYLFISHDISVVEALADRIAVMYLGRIVEVLPAGQLWQAAAHPYTRLLLASVPGRDPGARRLPQQAAPAVELPSLYALPRGCRFQSRCPQATELCRREDPALSPLRPGQAVACHHAATPSALRPLPVRILTQADPCPTPKLSIAV